jgi:hypothetical protein
MNIRYNTFILFMFSIFMLSCVSETNIELASPDGNTSLSGDLELSSAPVASPVTAVDAFSYMESNITLNYTSTGDATSCSVNDLTNVIETSGCYCTAGVCTVGITSNLSYIGAASFNYTVTVNSVESNSATVNYAVVDPINPNLIDPKYITATPDSVDKVSLFWVPGETSLGTYQISWVNGTTPPASCLEGNVITAANIIGESHQLTGITNPSQDTAFRICVVDNDGKMSVGTTVVQKTLPTCDYTVSVSETFLDFQTRLDASTDLNTDGKIAICLDDGVSVFTNNAGEGGEIVINTSDVYIYANRSSTASFDNHRTDTTSSAETAVFYLRAADNLSIANITLTTDGDEGYGFHTWSTARVLPGYDEISNLTVSTLGFKGKGILGSSRDINSIKDFKFTAAGASSVGVSSNGALLHVSKFTMNIAGNCSGGCALGFDIGGHDEHNIYWGSINTPLGKALYLWNASVENYSGVDMIGSGSSMAVRLNSFITNATDLYLETHGDWSSSLAVDQGNSYIGKLEDVTILKNGNGNSAVHIDDGSYINHMKNVQIRRNALSNTGTAQGFYIHDTSWVNTANVSDIELCSEVGATAWEDYAVPSEGLIDSNSSSPVSHVPYVPVTTLGAQTFPFDILNGSGAQGGAVAGKNIIIGGICSN